MCFSAGASFSAGSILSTAGVLSIRRAPDRGARCFAAIPLLFGLQQLSEGVLWLALQGRLPENFETWSMYIFLFFAQVMWPSWVPLSFYLLEKKRPSSALTLRWFVALGLLVSALNGWLLYAKGAHASIQTYHVEYILGRHEGWAGKGVAALYLVVTIVPPFFSARPGMRQLGLVLALSAVITYLMYFTWFVSVWCFFAAIISFWVLYLVSSLQESTKAEKKFTDPESAISGK